MVELIWAPSAVRDLENVAKYIENYSPQAARMQIQKLFRRSLFIQNNPGAGRPVPEL